MVSEQALNDTTQERCGGNIMAASGPLPANSGAQNSAATTSRIRPGRYTFINALNVLSCIAVVGLHVSLPVFTPARTTSWFIAVWFQACCIFAVPIFFLISGMNLLCYRERYSTQEFFSKRLRRVGGALIGGSVLCYAVYCLLPEGFYGAEAYAAGPSLTDFVSRFLTNQINDVYWFLYKIIYLYLLTPLISLALPNRRLMRYLICLTLIASVGIPLLANLGVDESLFNSLFSWPLFKDTSLLYFLLGGYIGRFHDCTDNRSLVIPGLSFLSSTALMGIWGLAANGWFGDSAAAAYVSYPISVASPLCLTQALSLFVLCQKLEPRFKMAPNAVLKAVSVLSGASLTVYLVHILFVNATPTGRFLWLGNFIHSNIFVELVSVYALSVLIGIAWSACKQTFKNSTAAESVRRLSQKIKQRGLL